MEVIIAGTHEYGWAMRVFVALFRKYVGLNWITWATDAPATALPAGVSERVIDGWDWRSGFARGLREAVRGDGIAALFLPDQWISGPADRMALGNLYGYMCSNPDVLRGHLERNAVLDRHAQFVSRWGSTEIVTVPPTDPHVGGYGGVSLTPALWNRRHLAGLLEDWRDPWETERLGTIKMAQEVWPRLRCVAARPGVLRRWNGLVQSAPMVASVRGLQPEDHALVRAHLPDGWRIEE